MTRALLLVAHPGHELLLQGWLSQARPAVHVLTNGSVAGKIERTAELLRELGARPGALFGRITDADAYAMILEGNATLLLSLITELAAAIETQHPEVVVSDAVEGYNPVHDLCSLIAGAAVEMAGSMAKHYEYPVVGLPYAGTAGEALTVLELDDAAHAAKIERAHRYAPLLPDVAELLAHHGADAFRRETLRRVPDWHALGAGEPPLYERFGEERVAAHRYDRVIRRDQHVLPLRDAVCRALDPHACAY